MIITRFKVILQLWDAAGVSLMYLVTVDLSHQLGAVSTCGGETCHCSGAGPECQRWAVGCTLHTERRPHSDLRPGNREESDLRMYRLCFHNDILHFLRNVMVTCGLHLLGRKTESCRCWSVHQLSAHPSKFKHLPALHYSRLEQTLVIPMAKYALSPSVTLNILEIHGVYSDMTEPITDRKV